MTGKSEVLRVSVVPVEHSGNPAAIANPAGRSLAELGPRLGLDTYLGHCGLLAVTEILAKSTG
jgi:hypothetical protein